MFNFFANLALAVYNGTWNNVSNTVLITRFIGYMKVVPIFGLFNNSTESFYNTTSTGSFSTAIPDLAYTIAVILSIICCISVFFIIVKALKKLFTCFLGD